MIENTIYNILALKSKLKKIEKLLIKIVYYCYNMSSFKRSMKTKISNISHAIIFAFLIIVQFIQINSSSTEIKNPNHQNFCIL